jgi:hypothetical protein
MPPAPAVPDAGAYLPGALAALAQAGAPAPAQTPPRQPRPAVLDFHTLIGTGSGTGGTPRPRPAAAPGPSPEELRTVAPGSQTRARVGVERSLRRLGVSEELATDLIEGAAAHALALAPRSGLAGAVRTTLAQRIPVAPALPPTGGTVVFVGGGGAGKTTSCATMLGAYRRSSALPASFASVTRRPGSADLELLLSPYVMQPVAADSAAGLLALQGARERGLLLVDTPSVSPADRGAIRVLARLLGRLDAERVVVALPATLGAVAARQLLEALAPLRANALAITHADETDQLGVAIEAACAFGLAPEYLLERGRPRWRIRRVEPSELAARLMP